MKKLLLHIGYPKTATTTLQESLFAELHKKEVVNYLGKDERKYESDLGKTITNRLLLDRNLNGVSLTFSSQKLNILSDEDFSLPKHYLERELGYKHNSLFLSQDIAEKIKDKVDNLEILVTLRAQQSLIYSFYAQGYKLYKDDKNFNTFDKYLSYGLDDKNQDFFAIFYFHNVLKTYSDYFGKEKIHVLLFEDYLNNKDIFIKKLSKIININAKVIENLLEKKHLNQREKTPRGIFREINKPNNVGKFIQLINHYNLIPPTIKKLYKKNNFIRKTFNRFTGKDQKFFIPQITKKQKNIIFEKFKKNNSTLAKEFNLDEEKFKKYGYI